MSHPSVLFLRGPPPPYLKGLLSLQKHPIESLEAYFECGFYDQIFLDCRSDPIPIGCRCFFWYGGKLHWKCAQMEKYDITCTTLKLK